MRNPYQQRNTATINRAFARFSDRKEAELRAGLSKLLRAALKYLDDAHVHHGLAHRHLEENNTMGWALVHDKQVLELGINNGGNSTPHGDATKEINAIVKSLPKGWTGVVLSDMANDWYKVEWEQDFLLYSLDSIRADGVSKYFKRIR